MGCASGRSRCSHLPSRSLQVVRVARALKGDWVEPNAAGRPCRGGPQAAVSESHPSGESGLRTLPRRNVPFQSNFKFVIASISNSRSPPVPSRFVLASSARQFQVRDRLSLRVASFSRPRPVGPPSRSSRLVTAAGPPQAALLGPLAAVSLFSDGSQAVSRAGRQQ